MVSHRSIWKVAAIAVIICMLATMVVPALAQDAPKAGPFKIGVAMRTQLQPRWIFDVKSMEARAKELGDEIMVQYADDDQAKQQSQVENLIAQGINVLILAPVNDTGAPKLVDIAKKAGIPVVAYDAPITGANIDYALTRDVYKTGLWQAEGCLKMYPATAEKPINVALIKGDQDYVHGQIWSKAYHDTFDPLVAEGKVKIVAEQWHKAWKPELALKTAENTLTANDDNVQCFVTSNDGMAVGVSQAVKARKLEGKVYISGLDADIANLRSVLDGVQTLTIWTMIDVMGKRAVDAAHALAAGQEPQYDEKANNGVKDVPTALIPVFAVTQESMCEWLTQVAPPGWADAPNVFESRPIPDACKTKAGPFKIGVAMRTQLQPRWIFDVKSMEARAKELGDEIMVQYADDDQAKQQSQVENLIAQGINVLILAPVNDTGAPKLVDIAKKAGIPVVAYDAPITGANIDYALTRDVYKTGLWQAEGCLKMYPATAEKPINVALIKGDQDYVHGQIWSKAYHDTFDPLVAEGKVKIVAEQWHKAWKPELALKTAENTLTANDDNVQCFVTSNDGMAVGVSQAVKARKLEGKVYISGLDADIANLRSVLDGVQTLTIWTMIDVMGKRAVDAAHALAANGKLEFDEKANNGVKDVPTALIPVFGVTQETMCEWLTQVAPPGWADAPNVFESRPIPDACKAQ